MKETKIAECINPERPCKGCTYSFNPALYDGGCTLYTPTGDRANPLEAIEPEGDSKSLQAQERTTAGERHAQKAHNQNGNIPQRG